MTSDPGGTPFRHSTDVPGSVGIPVPPMSDEFHGCQDDPSADPLNRRDSECRLLRYKKIIQHKKYLHLEVFTERSLLFFFFFNNEINLWSN